MIRIFTAAALLFALLPMALAQDHGHHHPPQDAHLHDTFYSKWNMPNGGQKRHQSCCNEKDCYATPVVRRADGNVYARRREDGKWLIVPASKLEQNQPDEVESPDGQSHACIAAPNEHGWDAVFCATMGGGT